jgi:hypothetical protein
MRGAEDIQAGLIAGCLTGDPSRHTSMLQESDPGVQ